MCLFCQVEDYCLNTNSRIPCSRCLVGPHQSWHFIRPKIGGFIRCKTVDWLQAVQSWASRLLTRVKRFEHITLVLVSLSLHWLLVCFRIDFKFLLITYKALYDLSPQHISELLSPYNPAHTLRSSGRGLLSVTHIRLKNMTDRVFWNTGPEAPCPRNYGSLRPLLNLC